MKPSICFFCILFGFFGVRQFEHLHLEDSFHDLAVWTRRQCPHSRALAHRRSVRRVTRDALLGSDLVHLHKVFHDLRREAQAGSPSSFLPQTAVPATSDNVCHDLRRGNRGQLFQRLKHWHIDALLVDRLRDALLTDDLHHHDSSWISSTKKSRNCSTTRSWMPFCGTGADTPS